MSLSESQRQTLFRSNFASFGKYDDNVKYDKQDEEGGKDPGRQLLSPVLDETPLASSNKEGNDYSEAYSPRCQR